MKSSSTSNFNLVAILLLLSVLGCVCSNANQPNASTNIGSNERGKANEPVNMIKEPWELSPQENLLYVNEAITSGDIPKAKKHLAVIPKGAPEYAVATKLIRDAEARLTCTDIEKMLTDLDNNEAVLDRTEGLRRSMDKTYGTKNMDGVAIRRRQIAKERKELEGRAKTCVK